MSPPAIDTEAFQVVQFVAGALLATLVVVLFFLKHTDNNRKRGA